MTDLLYILLYLLIWMGIGAGVVWRLNYHIVPKRYKWVALAGPFAFAPLFAQAMDREVPLFLTRADRKNPFRDDLKDALRQYRLIQFMPGASAEETRQELAAAIVDARGWPEKLRRYEGDKFVAALKSETDRIILTHHARLQAYENVEREALEEIKEIESS